MEASQKPQLQLDDVTIRLLADRLVIERLEIADERAARVVRERAEAGQAPADTIIKAIEIGARVLDSEETAVNVDYVRAEFERHAGALRRDLAKALEAGDEQFAERIATSFDPGRDGSVPKEIEERVKQALAEQREALLRLFSAEEGANPLFDFKDAMIRVYRELGSRQQAEGDANRKRIDELTRQIIGLKERDEANRRVAEEAERGTAKGRTFEELVHAAVDRLASGHGDAAHHTGDAASESGGKKGDTVVEIGGAVGRPIANVVFEAKNKKLSKNDAWAELNACMTERDSIYGVLVVAGDDKVPSGLEDFTEYQGNKIIVTLDREEPNPLALQLVYRYVRARVLASDAGDRQLDAAAVGAAAEAAMAHLKRANRVRKSLTNVTKSAETARTEFDEMVAEVERSLDSIESLLAEAELE